MVDHFTEEADRIDWGTPEESSIVAKTSTADFLQENISTGIFSTLHATDEMDKNFPLLKISRYMAYTLGHKQNMGTKHLPTGECVACSDYPQ